MTPPAEFGLLNTLTLVLYLAAMSGIGVYCARFNKSTDDFFRGGQSVPWWAAGLSIFATMLSSITYLQSLRGLTYYTIDRAPEAAKTHHDPIHSN